MQIIDTLQFNEKYLQNNYHSFSSFTLLYIQLQQTKKVSKNNTFTFSKKKYKIGNLCNYYYLMKHNYALMQLVLINDYLIIFQCLYGLIKPGNHQKFLLLSSI